MFRIVISAFLLFTSLSVSFTLTAAEEIGLEQLPDSVKQAAYTESSGLRITEASIESEHEQMVYELGSDVSGKEYEIEISADGRILEIDEDD